MMESFRANPSSPAASALSRCKWASMSARCDDTRNESSAAREICDAGLATERAAMRAAIAMPTTYRGKESLLEG